MTRPSFREQVLRVREDAIVASVNRLLAERGYDQMTVDQVAADVGIAKASLYKHFASKEALAAAAMVRVIERALAELARLAAVPGTPLSRLQAMAGWAMHMQLAGEMPALPAQNSALRGALLADARYVDQVMLLSDRLGEWITAAQAEGQIDPALPPELVLYTLYARACDPVLGLLKAGGRFSDEQAVAWVLRACFEGLAARDAPAAQAPPRAAARRQPAARTSAARTAARR